MDRTSRIGIFVSLALLLGLEFAMNALYPPPKIKAHPAATAIAPASPGSSTPVMNAAPAASQPASAAPVAEQTTILENSAIKVTLTSKGASVKNVELKQQKAEKSNIVLNQDSRSNILAVTGWPGADTADFKLETSSPSEATYATELSGGLKWERSYAFDNSQETETGLGGFLQALFQWVAGHLGASESVPLVYNLKIKDSLTNSGSTAMALPPYSLSIGRAEPLLVAGHYQPGPYQYPGCGWMGQKFHLTTVSAFNPGYVPLIGIKTSEAKDRFSSASVEEGPLRWLGAENQFFAVLLTPAIDRSIQHAEFQCFNARDSGGNIVRQFDPEGNYLPGSVPDIEASAYFPETQVPAGQTVTIGYELYAGPKDFNRLDALGADQGELMYYGMFSILIVPMLTVLRFWYLLFHNYGVAIILLTLMIKSITWPLQSIANHSGKRMQALAPKLKEMQAKYKEQPEKLQTETFALYREYGVNPFGGCLPALVQMPVFFSLYYMLLNAVELRGQSFLWVHDLTQPDTVFSFVLPFVIPLFNISHFALNPLPIMVTGLTMVMMRMTPQIGDPAQAKIAQFMPLVFLFIFYNFAAALSLYYVINNCVSIIQIYRNLRKPLPELKRKPRK